MGEAIAAAQKFREEKAVQLSAEPGMQADEIVAVFGDEPDETPRSQAKQRAVKQREARREERERQDKLDREREASFEAWRISQAVDPGSEIQDQADSSDDAADSPCAAYTPLAGAGSTHALEQQLSREQMALESEERDREILIKQLSPPVVDQAAAPENEESAREQALHQRELRRAEREEQDRLDRERETSWLSAPAPSARNFKALLNEDEEDEENIFSPVSDPRRDTSGQGDLQRHPSVNLEEMLAAEKLALEAEERDRAELILKLSPPKPACGEAAMP